MNWHDHGIEGSLRPRSAWWGTGLLTLIAAVLILAALAMEDPMQAVWP